MAKAGPKFDSGDFGSLRYDLTAHGGTTGVIEEPSDQDIINFQDGLETLMDESGIRDLPSREALAKDPSLMSEVMDKMREFNAIEQQNKIVQLVSQYLTGGSPSEEAIKSLPYRVRVRFVAWVQGQFVTPESVASGTTP